MSDRGRPGGRGGSGGRPARVRVTSPRMNTSRAAPRSPASEIDEQTLVGAVYMRSLLRSQLRLATTVILVMVLTLGTLPLLFATRPELTAIRVAGLPLPWVLIGVALYPLLVLAGAWLDRAADRAERDFTEIVSRSR